MVGKLPTQDNPNLSAKEWDALKYIRNEIVHRGVSPTARQIMSALGYKSPRSASLLLQKLTDLEIITRDTRGRLTLLQDPLVTLENRRVIPVPVIGHVAAGLPILAEENIESTVDIDESFIKSGASYYLLRVQGDSMNEVGIDDSDLVLVRSQDEAQDNQYVVALIDGNATIKELHRTQNAVILQPRSSNSNNKPIVLREDFSIQGVVVATIKNPTF